MSSLSAMPGRADRLTRLADSARPDLGIRAVVVAQARPSWLTPVELGVFLLVAVTVAGFHVGGPIVIALTASAAGWCANMVGNLASTTGLIACGERGAHLFHATHSPLWLGLGSYVGAVRADELVRITHGPVTDVWELDGRRVKVLRVYRDLLDATLGRDPSRA